MPPLTLPIFPLPDVTFFPHTMLPLHVFEARYRARTGKIPRMIRAGIGDGAHAELLGGH